METVVLAVFVAVAVYLLVFVALLTFGCVRTEVLAPIRETEWCGQPRWKQVAFTAIVCAGAAIGWPLFVHAWFFQGDWSSWQRHTKSAHHQRRP
jgi:hypothetical protein